MRHQLSSVCCPNPSSERLSHARFTPFRGFAGGREERIGGSLKRIASRSLERRDQAALCTPSAGFYSIDVREVFVVVVKQVSVICQVLCYPACKSGIGSSREFLKSHGFPGKSFAFLLMLSSLPPERSFKAMNGRETVFCPSLYFASRKLRW